MVKKIETQTAKTQTDETPQTPFLATLHAINARYEAGTLEYIRDHRPDLHNRLALALDRIDETGAGGGIATTAFKNVLRTWYNLNIDAINLFNRREKMSEEVKKEYDERLLAPDDYKFNPQKSKLFIVFANHDDGRKVISSVQ